MSRMVPDDNDTPTVLAVIEIPKGSRNKYEYDPELGMFKFDRMLFSSVHYPSDYGFIRETIGADGDPLDVLVMVGEPTFPGCIIEVTPVGLFKMWDEKGSDEKILAVPVYDPQWNWLTCLEDVPSHLLLEIEHFFEVYKELEQKKTGIEGWSDVDAAWGVISEAKERFREQTRK